MAATNVAIGCFFGASQVSVIAAVTHLGNISIATAVYGVMSITSLVAGLTYGAIRRRASHTVWDLTGGFLGLCLSAIALAQARGLLLLAILLLISGVFVAPTIITTGVIAERATPPEHVHSTFTVLTSLQGLGIAVGAATAGTLIDGGGSTRGFVVAAVATGLGAAAAIACAFSSTRGEGVSDK
jgi:predicted MFS family arabinose efflux permease